MKNIHVLKTSKPSKLLKDLVDKTYQFKKEVSFGNRIELPLNIYITSDEEIKEGDWFMSDFNSFPIHNIKELSEREGTLGWEQKDLKNNLKIILTTDQDLIKEGVQEIDDEFLEWFVKNPSCESIETHIVKLCTNCGQQFCDNRDCLGYKDEPEYLISFPENTIKQIITYCKGYEISRENIIIPKEEPKQETEHLLATETNKKRLLEDVNKQETIEEHYLSIPKPLVDVSRMKVDNHPDKQETLEEAAEKYVEDFDLSFYDTVEEIPVKELGKKDFKEGAKWQAERMYSEEEVRNIVEQTIEKFYKHRYVETKSEMKELWFEQFKNK